MLCGWHMTSVATNPITADGESLSPRIPARPELLAPAGDWECAKAAVENGADAIYFGLDRFNARMRAHNFTEADLPRLMEFLHRRGGRRHRPGRRRLPPDPPTLAGFSHSRLHSDDHHQRGRG